MERREGSFKGIGNANIYYQGWRPDGDPQAVLAAADKKRIQAGLLAIRLEIIEAQQAFHNMDHCFNFTQGTISWLKS